MTGTAGSGIFRASAVQAYIHAQQRGVLPLGKSLLSFGLAWACLGTLGLLGLLVLLAPVPTYVAGSAVVTDGIVVVVIPLDAQARFHEGDELLLFAPAFGKPVRVRLVSVGPGLERAEVRKALAQLGTAPDQATVLVAAETARSILAPGIQQVQVPVDPQPLFAWARPHRGVQEAGR